MRHTVRSYALHLDDAGEPGQRQYKVCFDGTVSDRDDIAMFAEEMRLLLRHHPCLVVAIFEPEIAL